MGGGYLIVSGGEAEEDVPAPVITPASASKFKVTVRSHPPDAKVFLDGELVGRTPMTVSVEEPADDAPNPVIRLEKEPFKPAEREVDFESRDIEVKLEEKGK
jgi:hypothetical protein